MKYLPSFVISVLIVGSLFSQRVDDRVSDRIETRVADRKEAFWWNDSAGGGGPTIPTQPQNLVVVINDPGLIQISWDLVAGEDIAYYNVYRDTTTGTTDVIDTVDPTTNIYDDVNVAASTTYYYQVSAVHTSGGESTKSNEVNATQPANGGTATPPTITLADADYVYLASGPSQFYSSDGWNDRIGLGAPDPHDWDVSTTISGVYGPWFPSGDGTYLDSAQLIGNSTFDSSTGWTLAPGITIGSGVLNIALASNREATYDVSSVTELNAGEHVLITADIVYTAGTAGGISAGNGTAAAFSGTGTYVGYVAQQTDLGNTIGVIGFTGASMTVDNFEAWKVSPGDGDHWVLDNTGQLSDSFDLDLGTTGDYAVEMWLAQQDWSTGFVALFASYTGGDQQFWFGLDPSGVPHHGASETASGGFGTNIGSATIYTTMANNYGTWRDGFTFPIWMRYEFDYDDGASQSRMRVGYSVDRGQKMPWAYTAWQNLGTGFLDYFDNSADLDFGHHDNGDKTQGTKLFELVVYDERDEFFNSPGKTFLYEFYPYQHNFDGTDNGHAGTLTITRNGSDNGVGDPLLVTTAVGVGSGNAGFNHTVAAGTPYTNIEDRSFVVYGRRHQSTSHTTATDAYMWLQNGATQDVTFQTDPTAGVPGSRSMRVIVSDGTNSLTTANIAYSNQLQFQTFGFSVDSTNIYHYVDGTMTTTARSTGSPGTVGNLDDGTVDHTMAYDQMMTSVIASFPIVIDSAAEWDGLETSILNSIPGGTGDGDAGQRNSSGGGGSTEVPIDFEAGLYDTYIFRQNNSSGTAADFAYEVSSIELYASLDATGTDLAENTDLDESTRATYPFATGTWSDPSDNTYVGGVLTERASNQMIDGDDLTSYTAATPPSPPAFGFTTITIYLEDPTRIRSAKIKYESTAEIPDDIEIFAKNRDNSGSYAALKTFVPASVTTKQTIINLQP
jgi:hypothetical protein